VQDWHFYPAEVLTNEFPCDVYYPINLGCFHIGDGSVNGQMDELLRHRSFQWESLNRHDYFGGLRQCRFCDREFQFDIIPFLDLALTRPKNPRLHDRYVATVTTTWANYGDGSPDLNGKYRHHFMDASQVSLMSRPNAVHNPVVFEPGSIRDAFEYGEEFRFESAVSKVKQRSMKVSLRRKDEKLARIGHPKFTNPLFSY